MKLVSLENLSKYNELLNQKTVKSVNSVKPDSTGNITLGTEKSTFNKVVFDTGYFSIGTDATYNFDLTGTDLENVSKDNINIRLVAKVTTAHNGYKVGDIAQLTPTVDFANTAGTLDVCTYIRGNTIYVYSGNNPALSINNGTGDWLQKDSVQIKAVLTAFIPDNGSILLIAEDQTNTSKLIGLPNGTLTWGDKNIVRSVNGVNADTSGNVDVISHNIQNTNNFASTFLYNNMGLKMQCIRISGNQGQQFGTINWLLPFSDTNYHVFATSEDPDENTYFQIPDVTLAGKTTTSCKVGHKVENANQFYTGGFISVVGIGY